MTTIAPPRPKTAHWTVGDAFTLGATRWAIRNINGDHVECESTNNPNAGIWWTTTLEHLPEKRA